jgi:hypothetical protein
MIHKAWTWLAGNADDLLKEAKVLDSIDNVLVSEYNKYMSLDKEQIKQVMKEEGWYIGKEELSKSGFVDEFIDAEENPEDISMARKAFANSIEKFKENAKENNAKPNFEAVAKVIENINNLATMPSDNEKIVNSNLGAKMEFNQENFNELLNANKVLSANRETMSNRYETLSA